MKTLTRTQLIKKADRYFSLAIRYRDADRHGLITCITCPIRKPVKEMHAGHFMSRRFMNTRWDDENVNGQCSGCNTFRAGEQYKYSIALDLKYGDGTAKRLHQRAQEVKKVSIQELEEIINEAKEAIKFYEKR